MKSRFAAAFVLGTALSVNPAWAAEPPTKPVQKRAPTAQQQRMKDCNAEAGSKALKGDPRKQFMRTCLKGKRAG